MWNRMHKPSKLFYGAGKWRAIALASVVLITITYVVINREKSNPASGLINPKKASFQSSIQFRPSLELLNGTDVIWQIPNSPKAALFIAHGCGVRAANFWDNYPGCLNCTGLPEERIFVLRALERKFAVLTISSLDRCWSFEETKNVKWIIKWWIVTNELGRLPIVAMGASSGGYFVSALAAEMRFSSITVMIAEGMFQSMGVPKDYPPTLFVHMPKDQFSMKKIQFSMRVLRQNGVPVKEIRCMQFPLYPDLFSDRIPGLNHTVSSKLYDIFSHKRFIDGNGYMKHDGRQTQWKEAVIQRNIIPENYQLLNHIEEELNLAFAYHEMTSFQADEILDWFESHMN
ncbi:hypothetical protein Cni_G21161 [Canna indica]|uniref:Uncharacterized protein n=1 Tax=Canna indica TaxID=4628 RepID=A0AAQ3KQ90_9LILI|nr:hypothetical protein Cni_G21161 [Canna indica]